VTAVVKPTVSGLLLMTWPVNGAAKPYRHVSIPPMTAWNPIRAGLVMENVVPLTVKAHGRPSTVILAVRPAPKVVAQGFPAASVNVADVTVPVPAAPFTVPTSACRAQLIVPALVVNARFVVLRRLAAPE
jgi:hypothetical protein